MSALLFWISAAIATLCTLLTASWIVVEYVASKSSWVSRPEDCSSTLLWLGCPIATKAFEARVHGLQEILLKMAPQILVISGNPKEVETCLDLIQVPKEVTLIADVNGYRTYASLNEIERFSTTVTVLSHRFHLKRVAFLAQGFGLSTILYPVGDELGPWTTRGRWREAFARLRAVVDRLFPHSEHQQQRNDL